MKGFVIALVVLVGGMIWLKDWATSGKMDVYLEQHKDPVYTPQVLRAIGEFYFAAQEHKAAAHYFKWILDEFPKYPNRARMHWQLGRSYEEIGKRSEALEQYTILKDTYSTTEYGALGHNRYGSLKY